MRLRAETFMLPCLRRSSIRQDFHYCVAKIVRNSGVSRVSQSIARPPVRVKKPLKLLFFAMFDNCIIMSVLFLNQGRTPAFAAKKVARNLRYACTVDHVHVFFPKRTHPSFSLHHSKSHKLVPPREAKKVSAAISRSNYEGSALIFRGSVQSDHSKVITTHAPS